MLPEPTEQCYPLPLDEFYTLRTPETASDDLRWRDILIAVAVATSISVCQQIESVDWVIAFGKQKWGPFLWLLGYGVAFATSTVIAFYLHFRVKKQTNASGYQRVVKKIEKRFHISD